jgi:hypothetical protein
MPLLVKRADSEVFALRGSSTTSGRSGYRGVLSWTYLPLQRQPPVASCLGHPATPESATMRRGASLEVLVPYSVLPIQGSGLIGRIFQNSTAYVFRFSQPLDAFFRPEPAGLISCRFRSWGSSLQSFTPSAQPYAVSGASCPLDVRSSSTPFRLKIGGRRSLPRIQRQPQL